MHLKTLSGHFGKQFPERIGLLLGTTLSTDLGQGNLCHNLNFGHSLIFIQTREDYLHSEIFVRFKLLKLKNPSVHFGRQFPERIGLLLGLNLKY